MWSSIAIICAVCLFVMFYRKGWLKRFREYRRVSKIVGFLEELEGWREKYNSPQSVLKRAQEAAEVLRNGFWLNRLNQKIFLDHPEIDSRLRNINEALETNFSYEEIGTNQDEVISFRNGVAHKTSALLQLELSRKLECSPRDNAIVDLSEAGGFRLEAIGTTERELKDLDREYYRRIQATFMRYFREWAMGQSDRFYKDLEGFERDIVRIISEERYTYEEMGTTEHEYQKLLRLAYRREVVRWVDFLKYNARKGDTYNDFARKKIREALEKASATLAEFDIAETDLDAIERGAFIVKAKKALEELRKPGRSWFYSEPLGLCVADILRRIPGDPRPYVEEIRNSLAVINATFAEIETSEEEMGALVRTGHIFSAKFLLEELKRISKIPRITQLERFRQTLGQKHRILAFDDGKLEASYPVDRDIEAIRYHLKSAEVKLEDFGVSEEKLQELRIAIEAR